jgi:copper chaperone CopZ
MLCFLNYKIITNYSRRLEHMEVLSLELPAMYGDHHVVEVRRLLFEIPGIEEVYASSGFHAVEITFDPAKAKAEDIKNKLDKAGYIGELPIPEEVPAESASTGSGKKGFFRHTAAYETTNQVVSFGQTVNFKGRALWPCPGMAPLTGMEEE